MGRVTRRARIASIAGVILCAGTLFAACIHPPPPPVPRASFDASPTVGDAPLTVAFTDTSTGPITSWAWDFGDGTSSTEQNPSHVFDLPANYRVALSVAGPGGASQTSQTIAVGPPPAPVASFSASPSSGEVPLTVSFTDTSSSPVTQWAWNFGDGGSSTEQNPTHLYEQAGLYLVSLIVIGPGGNDQTSQQVSVTSPPPPVADFTATPSAGNAPLAVTIAESSTGPITSWAWDFGDGTTSADQHPPVHTYATEGSYFVTLTVAGPGGTNTAMRGISVFPRPPNERPVVTITAPASPSTFTPGESITFTGSAVDDRDGDISRNLAWSSDIDGALGTGSSISVSTLSSGFHTITASVTDADGLTGSNPVGVRVNAPPVVSITSPASGSTFTFGQPIAFAGTATDYEDGDLSDRLNWRSDLDGTLSDLPSFSNSTLSVGTHTITAEASDLIVTANASITVNVIPPPPVASFDATPTAGEVPLTVTFTDTSTGTISTRSWDLGDGTTSTAASLTHRYDTDGSYTVTLTVTGPGGTVQATGVITVNPPPQPVGSFVATPTTGDVPLTVRFTDTSSGPITSWDWDFGDGATSAEQHPSHTYSTVGTYLAALTVTGPGGFHSVGQYITVTAPPVASFDASTTSGDAPLAVSFTDTSTGTIDTRSWDFGDGATSTDQNPYHTYATPGTYTATLTLTGPTGTDEATKTITVTTPPPPVASFSASLIDGTLTYVLTDRSTGNISSWAWNFGDGATSTAQHPTHSYELWGSPHTITLTVTGLGGTSQSSHTVSPPFPAPPVASFTATPESGDAPLTVAFTDTSTGALWMNPSLTPWVWDFGDGSTSLDQNPTHTYVTPGSYSVRLIRYGAGGGDDVFKAITVNAP